MRKGLKELKKNPALFSTDDAMLDLGVGSKMVKAIKYWLLATGLVEEKYAKNKREYFTTEDCGEIISEYDPYFEDIFTLYVLHSNIVRNKELCIVWHLFFNNFEAQDFTREDVYQVLKHELDKAIEQEVTYSDSLLKDDCSSLIRMYVKDMKETADPEEDLGSPFEALGFISPNELKSGRYLKTTPRYGKIDKLAILYVMRKNMKEGKDSVSITELLKEPNNIGKTFNLGRAVVQAFNWCLYGTCDGFKNQDLLNYEVARTMGLYSVQTVGVEIELIHENRLYVIRRSQLVRKTDFDKIKNESPVLKIEYKEENGEMQQESEYGCLSRINKILPQALSGYFFFDGEHISDINNKKDVVAAVRGLMGLDVISAAVDDLNPSKASSVVSKLRGELDVGQDAKSERMKTDLAAQKGKLEFLQKQLQETEDEIAFFEGRKKELEAKILANADTKNRQEERTRIEKDIKFLEKTQEDLEAQLVKEFSKNTYKFFAYPLYQKLLDVIAEAKKDGEGIPEMHSKAIDFILSRGKCICGCDLTENQGAVRHIKYEQSLLPPEHIGTTVRKYKEESQRNSLIFKEFADQIRSTYIRIRENANQLDEKRSYLLELSRLLQGNVDVGKFERDNQENEKQLRDRRNKAMSLAVQIGECNNRIKSLEASIEGLVVANTTE